MKRLLLFFTVALFSAYNIFSQVPQSERDALIAFYNATNGVIWTNNSNWNSANPISTWYAVTTEIINGNEHVTRLTLDNNNLSGFIAPEIGNLPYLDYFDLGTNNISGSVGFP